MKPFRVALGTTVMLVCACDTGGVKVAGIEGGGAPAPAAIVGNGQITSLGSILVGGIEYSLDQTNISIDGQPGTAADLAVGQIVTFAGTLNDATHAQALTVSYQTDIAGPIDAVDPSGASITVLGQKIAVDPDPALSAGRMVAISGFRNALGAWSARHVGPAAASLPLIVTGSIDHLNTLAKTFNVGDLVVDYSTATISELPNGLATEAVVRITGAAGSASGSLVASTVTGLNPALPGSNGDAAFVEGWVTRFASLQDFDVNGHRVISTSVSPDPVLLQLNRFVQVNGKRLQDGGVEGQATVVEYARSGMLASPSARAAWWAFRRGSFGSVSVDRVSGSESDIQDGDVVSTDGEDVFGSDGFTVRARTTQLQHVIAGPVDSVDIGHGRLVVMGLPVFIKGFSCTHWFGDLDLAQTLTQLHPGDLVTVSGHSSRAGDILATRINRVPTAPLLVSGFVQALDTSRSQFTLSALTIDYGQAQLMDFPSAAPLPGDHVVAWADHPPVHGVLTATRLKHVSEFMTGKPGADAWMEGLITRWVSLSDFDVDGRRVSLIDAPDECGVPSFQLNELVVLGGTLDKQGIVQGLVPGSTGFFCPRHTLVREITLTGPIDAIDVDQGALTMFGFAVQTNIITRITKDGGSAPNPILLADLQAGAFISVHGLAGGMTGSIIASAIDASAPLTAGIGQIETGAYTLTNPAIVVAGLSIPTNSSTTFKVTSSRQPYPSDSPATWFFSGRWQNRCNKRPPYPGVVHLTLDRGANGAWLATDAEATEVPSGCPDASDDPPAPPAGCGQ